MSKIATVKAPEQWIKELNGGYDICFQTMTIPAAMAEDPDTLGTVYTVGGEVVGIIATVEGTTTARVMVRGNPSLVDIDCTAAQANALKAKGIVTIGHVE